MWRAYYVFGDRRYERLASISVSHRYNLRTRPGYRDMRRTWSKTRKTAVPIGERRAPDHKGEQGFIRIDSVHQGDLSGMEGIYHINTVDCLTQWERVATCKKISEAYLLPGLELLLAGFPFLLLGFPSDNGSQYVNHRIAQLLEKARVDFTKSRPRHPNNNSLARTKNAAVIRKHLGFNHISQRHAKGSYSNPETSVESLLEYLFRLIPLSESILNMRRILQVADPSLSARKSLP